MGGPPNIYIYIYNIIYIYICTYTHLEKVRYIPEYLKNPKSKSCSHFVAGLADDVVVMGTTFIYVSSFFLFLGSIAVTALLGNSYAQMRVPSIS